MSGTGLKCMKCEKVFRQIHGISTENLHKLLTKEESEIFYGDDFFCCGNENIKTLFELEMKDKILELQRKWLIIMSKLYEKNSSIFFKIQKIDEKLIGKLIGF
jgi:hypothetical protein